MKYEFGSYILDSAAEQLLHDGEPVSLRPKTYEILLILIEKAGETVPKEEILARVWPDKVVEEANLTQHIHKLRHLFGDTLRTQEFILTIPGRGYYFNQNVRIVGVNQSEPAESDQASLTRLSLDDKDEVGERDIAGTGDLEAAGRSVDSAIPFSGQTSRRWRTLLGLLILLIVPFGVYHVYKFYKRASTVGNPRLPVVNIFASLPGAESYPSFSPNDSFLAFTSEGESRNNEDIYIKLIDRGEILRLTTHPDRDQQPVWSPDGTQLAFLRKSPNVGIRDKLIVVPVLGGQERVVSEVFGGLAWSPDGQYLAVSDQEKRGSPTAIYLISVDGTRRIKVSNPPDRLAYDTFPSFSPDGRRIAFVRWLTPAAADLYVQDLPAGIPRRITSDNAQIPSVSWLPSGNELLFVSNRQDFKKLWKISADGGEPVKVPNIIAEIENIAISRDGRSLAYTQSISDSLIEITAPLENSSAAAKALRQSLPCQIDSSRTDDTPRISPDGQKIVFVSERSGFQDLWVARSDCTGVSRLTQLKSTVLGSPRWSPDGSRIAFDLDQRGNVDIFSIGADGNGLIRLTNDPTDDSMPSWSHDGKSIYFTSERSGSKQIWRISADGSNPTRVTNGFGREPIESNDGRFLFYTWEDRLMVRDMITGTESAIPELSSTTVGRYWDYQPNSIYFVPLTDKTTNLVRRLDLSTRLISTIFEIRGYRPRWVPGLSVSHATGLIATSFVNYRLGDITIVEHWQ